MTIGDSLAAATATLLPSESARFDARALLGALLRRNGAWLIAHADERLEATLQSRFMATIARRAGGEPVAYILGEAGFYGRQFIVTPDVLVPRPESEGLVTCALDELRADDNDAPRLCDAGTGSGILAVTLAAEMHRAKVTAIDVSAAALAIAERNARVHGVEGQVRTVLGDVRTTLGLETRSPAGRTARFDGIVANLPYVATGDLAAVPDPTAFEPRLALDGGADGLAIYRGFLAQARTALAPDGWLFMEAGPETVPALARSARATFGDHAHVFTARDFAGLERIVGVRAPAGAR